MESEKSPLKRDKDISYLGKKRKPGTGSGFTSRKLPELREGRSEVLGRRGEEVIPA